MAAALLAASDEDTVGAVLKGFHKIIDLQPARARRPDNANVRRVLQSRRTGEIGGGISAVMATKGHDGGLIITVIHH
jgi:hypothetical protein